MMNFEMPKSRVYVLTDERKRITRCEGGYTTPADLTGWLCIDEGTGDRFNLCQNHYFDGGLYTMDGIPRYKLQDGAPVLRSEEEIEADRAARPDPVRQPTVAELAAKNQQLQEQNDLLTDLIVDLVHTIQAEC